MNPRRTNGSKRDKLRRRVLREEAICHLCGQDVDRRLPHGLPGSPELDEIIPVSLGGSPYDRSNVHLAHRNCNRQRSTLPVPLARAQIMADLPRFGIDGMLVATTLEPVASRRWL